MMHFFTSHDIAGCLLRNATQACRKRFLQRHVETRWSSKFNSIEALLQAKECIVKVAATIPSTLIDSNVEDVVMSNQFWIELKLTVDLFMRLRDSIDIVEGDAASIATAAREFLVLMNWFLSESKKDGANECVTEAFSAFSLRFEQYFEPETCAAYLLDPLFRGDGMPKSLKRSAHKFLNKKNIGTKKEMDDFDMHLDDFELRRRIFGEDDVVRKAASLSQARWWAFVERSTDASPHLVDVGKRLGSIPSSSASAERVWSQLGNIHTKTRNKLQNKKVEQLGVVHYDIVNHEAKRMRLSDTAGRVAESEMRVIAK